MSQSLHQSVLFEEALEALAIDPEGVYVDGTFGRGGHSRAILERLGPRGRLYAFDRDPAAIAHAEAEFGDDERFCIAHAPFSELAAQTAAWGIQGGVDGLLLDVGVSSPQLDDAERGFSFRQEGPLDMRMDPTRGQPASQWLMEAEEKEIARVVKEYGEERFARRIARAIVTARAKAPLETTRQLAEIVAAAVPSRERGKDPATRTFQAVRIHINRELEELETALEAALEVLAVGGRLVVISFHSLEDRLVKRFMHRHSRDQLPPDLPVQGAGAGMRLKPVGKLVRPGEAEIAANPRARSSRMRVAEKLA